MCRSSTHYTNLKTFIMARLFELCSLVPSGIVSEYARLNNARNEYARMQEQKRMDAVRARKWEKTMDYATRHAFSECKVARPQKRKQVTHMEKCGEYATITRRVGAYTTIVCKSVKMY